MKTYIERFHYHNAKARRAVMSGDVDLAKFHDARCSFYYSLYFQGL